jgi:ABC-2 type transport system ATP-binding protein
VTPDPPAAEPLVQLEDVHKAFGGVAAVRGLTLAVHQGEMFGLIGPDGAGKTTTLRLVCGLVRPDRGTVRAFGAEPAARRSAVTRSIGYVSQRFSLYGDLSIDENIEFFARIHHAPAFADRRERLLALTGLASHRARLADRLSGGMKQKLALACVLIHEPPLLVLDEPTTGVDPVSRREFWKLLAECLDDGLTIILATPYLDEAERCSRVALLDAGQVVASNTPAAIQAESAATIVEIAASPLRPALAAARLAAGADRVQLFGDRLHVRVEDDREADGLVAAVGRAGVDVTSVRRVRPTLEDVFIERVAGRKKGQPS